MNVVYIMRGISGSGKSTVAKKLALKEEYICSTDSYFMVNGEYKFDVTKLGYYHKCNFELFTSFLEQNVSTVVVDNTNCKRSEFKKYVDKAKELGYEVFEVAVGNPWRQVDDMRVIDDEYVKKCAARNSHNVPLNVIMQQARNFQA